MIRSSPDIPAAGSASPEQWDREMAAAGNNEYQSSKTHCPHGHEYTPENTKLIKSTKPGKFKRQCRQCKRGKEMAARVAKNAQPIATDPAAEPVAA
jgi:hypothetical protein